MTNLAKVVPTSEVKVSINWKEKLKQLEELKAEVASQALNDLHDWVPEGGAIRNSDLTPNGGVPYIGELGGVTKVRKEDGDVYIQADTVEYRLKDMSQTDVIELWEYCLLDRYETEPTTQK